MKIAIGSDHAGFEVKMECIPFLADLGHKVIDVGTHSLESVDYPEFGHKVGQSVASGNSEVGIVICGTGIGISIAANKVIGIRAALCTSTAHAQLSREHNDANVLAVGARMTELPLIKEIIQVFLSTNFEGNRHSRRVNKIELST